MTNDVPSYFKLACSKRSSKLYVYYIRQCVVDPMGNIAELDLLGSRCSSSVEAAYFSSECL